MDQVKSTSESGAVSLSNPVFIKFLLVNALFIVGMAALLIMKIHNLWLWVAYVSVWWWAEVKASHGLQLGWKGWTLFFAIIIVIDLSIIWATI